MGTYVEIDGNLLQNPEQRTVKVKGQDRRITEIRVFSDVYKRDPQDDSKLIQDDAKSFPYNVTIWNERLAEDVMKLLRKGARVQVNGQLTVQEWDDKDTGEGRFTLHVDADDCTLKLNRVEKIELRAKRTPESAPAESSQF